MLEMLLSRPVRGRKGSTLTSLRPSSLSLCCSHPMGQSLPSRCLGAVYYSFLSPLSAGTLAVAAAAAGGARLPRALFVYISVSGHT